MKKRSPKQYADALYEVTKDAKGEKLDAVLRAFVVLLARDRMLKKVDVIVEEFEKKCKREDGVVELDVTTARSIGDTLNQKLKQVFGDKTEITESVDEEIMGGVVVRTGGEILDASLKTQLQLLKQQLS